jgi:uncharacterized damage-inducible protein DinB
MEWKEIFLDQLEREAVFTRKAIERVPEGRNSFKPHPRSMELGYLAALVATMLGWVAIVIETDEIRFGEAGEEFTTRAVETRAELLQLFEEKLAKSRAALQATTQEHLFKPWRFIAHGQVISEDSRHIVIADSVFSHLAHHRGQLTVYLRLNDVSVPAIYGPSADERI